MPSFSVTVPAIFSFGECLRYLNRSSQESLHAVSNRVVKKAVRIGETPTFLQVTSSPSGLLVEYHADQAPAKLVERLRTYVAEWFDLNADLNTFYRLAKRDTLLAPVVRQNFGLRLVGIPDLFEALSWAIMGQQINLSFAYTLKRRLVMQFGTSHVYSGHTHLLFPLPQTIAACSPNQLTALQFSARKAEYLIGIARAMDEGRLTKEQLLSLSEEEARESLVRYRGVGSWTANYVLLKCLRYPDAFPAKDVGLHNAIKQQLKLSQKPALSEVYNYAVPWQGWRGYATFYLWQSLLSN